MPEAFRFPGHETVRRLATSGRIQALFILGCALVLAGLGAAYMLLAKPAGDDFCRAAIGTGPAEGLRYVVGIYENWSGRWLANLLYALTMPYLGLRSDAYAFAIAGLALTWLGGFLVAVRLISGAEAPRRYRWGLACLLLAIFWSGAPAQREAFYWVTGQLEYAVPFLLLMLALRLLSSLDENRKASLKAVASGILGIAVSGLNELAGALLVAVLACCAAASWRSGRSRLARLSLVALVLAGGGLVLNLGAPGNASRAAQLPLGGDILRGVAETLKPYDSPLAWLADFRMAALSLLLLAFPRFRAFRPGWTGLDLPWAAIIPGGTLIAIMTGHFLVATVLGYSPPGRVHNLLYALLLTGWLATLVAVAAHFDLSAEETGAARAVRSLAALFLGLSLVTSPNAAAAVRDLPRAIGPWRQQNAARERSAAEQIAAGRTELVLPPIAWPPAPLMDSRLAEDPAFFANRCLADHLHVRSVRIAQDSGAPPSAR